MSPDSPVGSAITVLLAVVLVASLAPSAGLAGVVTAQTSDPNVQVTIDATNSPVVEGETLTVDVTVENTGGATETQSITLSAGGAERDSTEVTLGSGKSRTLSLAWGTGADDAGSYSVEVVSADDAASRAVRVESGPEFTVAIDGTNSPIVEGERLSVDATVENTGGATGTQTVALSAGGVERDSTTVTLVSGETVAETLVWQTRSGDAGSYTVQVQSADDHAVSAVQVTTPETTTSATPTSTLTGTATQTATDATSSESPGAERAPSTTVGDSTGDEDVTTSTKAESTPAANGKDGDAGGTAGQLGPGFGPIGALLALLAVTVVAASRHH